MKINILGSKNLNWLSITFFILAIILILYLSFQYFILADFPIGQDVIYHLNRVLRVEREGLLSSFNLSVYPLSVIFLVGWHKFLDFLGLDLPRIFIFMECFYLFSVAMLSGILSYKVFKDWRIAVITMILVASSRWLNDYLRIGLMAEMLGLVFFIFALIMLFEKKWLWMIAAMALLFLSHPLPFFVFLLVFFSCAIFWFFSKKEKKKIAILLVIIVSAFMIGAIYLFWPQYIRTVLYYFHYYIGQKDGRGLIQYMIDYDKRRIIFYALGFLGVIWSLLKFKKTEKFWLFFIFSVLSFLICFKQYLGIHYLSFRFYSYFEVAVAISAAYAIANLGKMSGKWLTYAVILLLTFFCIYPNYWSNKEIINWQIHDEKSGNILPLAERNNAPLIKAMVNKNLFIYSHSTWVLWMKFVGLNTKNDWSFGGKFALNKKKSDQQWLDFFKKRKIGYIYFSSVDSKADIEKSQILKLIFNKDNIRLYEVKTK